MSVTSSVISCWTVRLLLSGITSDSQCGNRITWFHHGTAVSAVASSAAARRFGSQANSLNCSVAYADSTGGLL
jgi:hypothetical protein